MATIPDINNGEGGLSVRGKLNALIKAINTIITSDNVFNVLRINASYVKDATPSNTKFLRDDGTWQTVNTNQTLSQTLANGNTTGANDIVVQQEIELPNESANTIPWIDGNNKLKSSVILLSNVQLKSNKGIANGYASLDASGLVPSSQLPSYVDDILEFTNLASFPLTGESSKIYIALDTNLTYRWSGTIYVELTDKTAIWGQITGTLSNQTDLQSALNLKEDLSNKGVANGYASLNVTGKVPVSQMNLPPANQLFNYYNFL